MNRLAVIVTLVAPFVIPLSVLAAQSAKTGGELPDLPLEALYFGGENPALTPSEERALRIAREWQAKAATQLTPVPGPDGAIQFLYGAVQPSIVCAVMQVTDIELQPGEQINNINIGDSARWLVEPAVTGAGVAEVQHIVIKPMDVGLETSLMVTTNRRTYHFRLKSHKTQYMPKISFIYPDAVEQRFLALKERQKEEKERIPFQKPKNTLVIWILTTVSVGARHGSRCASTMTGQRQLFRCLQRCVKQKRLLCWS